LSSQTLNSIISGLATAIGSDADITEWVVDHYGEDVLHQVHIGIDYDHPPHTEDGPIIEIATGKRRRHMDTYHQVHQVQLGTVLSSASTTTTGNVHIHHGVQWVNDLAVLVEHAAIEYLREHQILWSTSDGLPDASGGKVYRAVWAVDVSVRDVIAY
jgi:hypothetical protein